MRIQFLIKNTGMHERLGIMTLSSILKQHGHAVDLMLTEDLSEEECLTKIRQFAPHILAYSMMTGEHNYHIRLNEIIKNHYKCFSIFGGPHPTFNPEMINKNGVDAICRGEGDIYFSQLVERMEHGKDFYDIPNFWFKKPDGRIVRNPMGPLVKNLDELPFPDRKLMYDADPSIRSRGIKLFMSMRGCPYQCTYCFNHVYNSMLKDKGQMLRHRSVGNLLAEINRVKENYYLDRVLLDDDTFLLKPDGWLEEFAERYPREIALPLICNVRANLVTDKVGRLLRQMNCITVNMGIECGNNEIANNVLKRHISNEQIINACKILHASKIRIWTENLIGLPVEDPLKVDLRTLDFNIGLGPDFASSSAFYPYPGTELGQLAIDRGMFDADFEKVNVSSKTGSALNFKDPKLKRKIVNLHKLFGVTVQWPFLRPFTLFLISLPLTHFYTWVFFALYGYKTLRLSGGKGFFKSMRHYLPFYFKYVARLEKRTVFKSLA
ncbi:MAG: cobalamin-dependent protein [Candidatus Omnitrophica bacterium]|nr:cobalamin-dependent protein [Candidatus Omnitrophota bacterium]